MQLFYKIIYSRRINWLLRSISKAFGLLLPKKFRIHPSGQLKIKTENGQQIKFKTNQTNYITYLIFWDGYLNFEYTDLFIKLIRKVETFFDIGANIGYYSLIGASEKTNLKIVAFEPAKGPHFYFNENVRINNFQNIKVEPIALSHKEGEIDFHEVANEKYQYLKYNLAGEGNAGSKTESRKFSINKVRTMTLDNYVKTYNVEKIDLIKMDTEGTEHLILQNAEHVLRDLRPIIICETLFDAIETELENIFNSYGYKFYQHTASGLKLTDTLERKDDDGIRNCFFVHPSKFQLIEEFVVK